MTSVEQRKMIQRLKGSVTKLTSEERPVFEMMAKRDRDDEELDSQSMQKLVNLYEKYFPKKSKEALEEKWNKLTRQG